jgi:hypothetical protein
MIRCAFCVMAVVFWLGPWAVCSLSQAQDKPGDARERPVPKKLIKGRLPAYYASIVNDEQRQRIYQIQASYNPKIDALQAEIEALVARRDAEIRGVLTPDQQKRLDARMSESRAGKAARRAGEKDKAMPVKKVG